MSEIFWLAPDDPDDAFPDPTAALDYPNGLVAAGGDLRPTRLLAAYCRGIFPWYEAGQPILWWSPDPRAVLYPKEFRTARSLRRKIRRRPFQFTTDQAFTAVMQHCAAPREGSDGTWITDEMIAAYTRLSVLGFAHSVEVWDGKELAGGIYGIALGKVFFGESMFSGERDASKLALAWLIDRLTDLDYELIDCQIPSDHLDSLGSRQIPRQDFLKQLKRLGVRTDAPGDWPLQSTPA